MNESFWVVFVVTNGKARLTSVSEISKLNLQSNHPRSYTSPHLEFLFGIFFVIQHNALTGSFRAFFSRSGDDDGGDDGLRFLFVV